MTTTNDDALSSHRVRSNVWPTRPTAHPQLVEAINAIFEQPIEDRD